MSDPGTLPKPVPRPQQLQQTQPPIHGTRHAHTPQGMFPKHGKTVPFVACDLNQLWSQPEQQDHMDVQQTIASGIYTSSPTLTTPSSSLSAPTPTSPTLPTPPLPTPSPITPPLPTPSPITPQSPQTPGTRPTPAPRPRIARHRPTPSGAAAKSGPGTQPKPVPRPRRPQETPGNLLKRRLVDSFARFSSNTISEEQIQAAKDCIHYGGPSSTRYVQIPFDAIMTQNQHKNDHLTMMTSAYDLLLTCVINLMKPRRPQVWRSIKTNNTAFRARVSCMEGAKEILRTVGYSIVTETAMQFPEHITEPNRTLLEAIAAELLMAKLEVDEKNSQQPSPPQQHPLQLSSDQQQYQGTTEAANIHTRREHTSQGMFPNPRSTIPFVSQDLNKQQDHMDIQQTMANGIYTSSPMLTTLSSSLSTPTPMSPTPPTPTSPILSPVTPQSPQTPGTKPTPVPRPRVARNRSTPSGGTPAQQTQSSVPYQQQSSSGSDVTREEGDDTTPARPRTARSDSTLSNRSDLSHSDSLDSVTSNESGRSDSISSTASSHQEFLQKLRKDRELRKHMDSMKKVDIRSAQVSPADPSSPLERGSKTCVFTTLESGHDHTKRPVQRWSSGGLQNGSTDSEKIKHPPGKREHPSFVTDTIPEEEEPKPDEYCENCNCRLNPGDSVCLYCSGPVSQRNNNFSEEILYSDPPESAMPYQQKRSPVSPQPSRAKLPLPLISNQTQGSVVRASPQAAEEAVQQFRKSQLQRAVDPNARATQVTQPQLQMRTERFEPAEAIGWEQMVPKRPYVDHEQSNAATAGYYNENEVAQVSSPSSSQGEASGVGDPPGASRLHKEESYEEYLKEKEKAWKEKQLRQGIKQENLEPLQERVEYERKQKQQKQTKVDVSRFPRVNQTDLSKYEKKMAETERMDKLERDGYDFLSCVKVCIQHGFSMAEIQIAFQNPAGKDPLRYLLNEWTRTIRNIQFYVSAHNQNIQQSVGEPSEEEARKCLVEADGDMTKAIYGCYEERREKTEELLKKMNHLPECKLTWEGAVRALTLNNMDVDTACWVIQCDTLQPLYESIFSEWQQVKQKDMEEIKELIKNKDFDQDVCHRLLMAECRLDSHDRAHMVFELMEEVEGDGRPNYPLGYYVEAAKDYSNIEDARQYLIKPCPICVEEYPIHEMVTMPGCTDSFCKDCFTYNFTIAIKEKSVKHFNCPLCSEPDLANRDMMQQVYLELFVGMVKEHTDVETYNLCQQKLTDFNLSKEAGFRWCANEKCKSGFINEQRDDIRKLQCPTCSHFMCFQCKKPWEDQHNDISCEAFAQWKKDNDPEAQQQGLAAHLTANGIDCPNCHMRYDLARGGCMHFRCTQCPNEFCSGCGGSFKNGKACGRFESCAGRGLHAHHPRDCLFYLRDFSVQELQYFLREHDVEFHTEPPQGQLNAARQNAAAKKEAAKGGEGEGEGEDDGDEHKEGGKVEEEEGKGGKGEEGKEGKGEEKVELKCCVMLQKELAEGLVDEECGRDVPEGHAGLCETHYKEYLVDKINKAKLDPITIYETLKIKVMLTREEMDVPEKEEEDGVEEDEDVYRERLIKHVQDVLPLDRK